MLQVIRDGAKGLARGRLVLSKDQTVDLFKQAMNLLIDSGIRIEEMTRVAGLEPPAIEVKATKAAGAADDTPESRTGRHRSAMLNAHRERSKS
jgi:hypothetical protein